MKAINTKSKKGFTLIELLVVIGILAVLVAIAIPSVAGLIDRANVSADNTNANEMTNAMERFVSEYELFRQDIANGTFDVNNMDATQGRVYNVIGVSTNDEFSFIEKNQNVNSDDVYNEIALCRDTKYPINYNTIKLVLENYMKTSSSTFEPKQSDMHYWYSPDCGVVVVAEPEKNAIELDKLIVSGKDAKGKDISSDDINARWIDITKYYTLYDSPININDVSNTLADNDWSTIRKVIKSGKVNEVGWKVGDLTQTFEINGKTMQARIIGINQDGNNTVTFMFTNSVIENRMYEDATNIGGFPNSEINSLLNNEIFNELDEDMKYVIKSIPKNCNLGGKNRNTTTISTKLFLLSVKEAGFNQEELNNFWSGFTSDIEKESEFVYDYFIQNSETQRKTVSQALNSKWWWLRSAHPNDNDSFCGVGGDGNFSNRNSYKGAHVVPAFVIG